jgi:hypothetical protein
MDFLTKQFQIDEPTSLAMLASWREIALQQVDETLPQEAAAFFDLVKRLPGYFLRHHIGAVGKASEHFKKQSNKQKSSLVAVGHYDLIAPYLTLDNGQLNGYVNFVGLARVAAEINFAFCSDLLISQDAKDFASSWINQRPQDWIVGKEVSLRPLNSPLMLSPTKEVQPKVEVKTVIDTKSLEETSAAMAFAEPTPIPYPAPRALSTAKKSIDEIDLADHMTENMYSYAIISPSGGGKGTLASHAIRKVKEVLPHIKIIVIDAKGSDRESGNWEGVADVIHSARFADLDYEDKESWIKEGLDLHRNTEGPSLLVFDEATMVFSYAKNIKSLYNRLIDFVTCIASSGNDSERYVWLMGHSPNLSDYGLSGGQMGSFHKLFIAPTKNIGAIKQLGQTSFAGGFGEDKVSDIVSTGEQSEVKRCVYLSTTDTWYPMKKVKLHSGFNRDERTFEHGFQPKVEEWNDDEFISKLATELRSKKPEQLQYVTADLVLNTEAAKKRNLTREQATIAIKKAQALL